MSHAPHGPARRAEAARPTLSLLRWSAARRVLAASGVLALLWAGVAAVLA